MVRLWPIYFSEIQTFFLGSPCPRKNQSLIPRTPFFLRPGVHADWGGRGAALCRRLRQGLRRTSSLRQQSALPSTSSVTPQWVELELEVSHTSVGSSQSHLSPNISDPRQGPRPSTRADIWILPSEWRDRDAFTLKPKQHAMGPASTSLRYLLIFASRNSRLAATPI